VDSGARQGLRSRPGVLELHALPPRSLPDGLEDLIEDLIAPGYRERLLI